MRWEADGYILSVRNHGETSAIINIFTREYGRHAGLVRGGRSRRLRPVLQAGNKISARWSARLSEHLGVFNIEALDARGAVIMQDRKSLTALNAISALCVFALAERQPYHALFDVFEVLLASLDDFDLWPALYVRFELALLSALGYGLDFSTCAATGTRENLTHISPKSGRAVCADAAAPYIDKLFAIPAFLQGDGNIKTGDIKNGLALSGYFLEKRVFAAQNKALPQARKALAQMLGV